MKLNKSLSYKVLTILTLSTILVLLALQSYTYYRNHRNLYNENSRLANRILDRISNSLISPIWNLDFDEVNKILMLELANENVQAIIVHSTENELYAGKIRNNKNSIVNYLNNEINNKIIQGSYLAVNQEIFFEKESIGVVEVRLTDKILNENLKALILNTVFQTLVLAFFTILIAYSSLKKIVLTPIFSLHSSVENILKNNYEDKAPVIADDEIGRLARTFNNVIDQLANSFRKQEELLGALEKNNHTLESQKSTLIKSNEQINKSNLEMELRNWIKTGQNELSSILRNEQVLSAQIQAALFFIAEYSNSVLGAFYLKENESLIFHCGYNFSDERLRFSSFSLNDGVLGEACKKNEISIIDTNDQFPKIDLGFQEVKPRYFLFVPLYMDDGLLGLIEIASTTEYKQNVLEFLEESTEIVATTIGTTQQNQMIKELLHQTQSQSEQLQEQQEELIQTNEELSSQTKALRESEERLQLQQEKLRVTNEELEERSKALEQQRDFVSKQNDDLKEAQEEIHKKAADLEAANKYKSEFLANMSHELRTPLNSILILAQLLKDNKKESLSKKEVEFATTIYTSGNDLLSLINEVLDLSKVEAGHMLLNLENIRIRDIVDRLKRIFTPVSENKNLEFEIIIADDVPKIIFNDMQRVQQVLRNLLSNAFKFTEEGKVKLSVHLNNTDEIAFSILDTGIGISVQKLESIFEAFKQADGTTSRVYGGTGLGLSISRELAKLMGGIIIVESTVNVGSKFTFKLPIKFKEEDLELSKDEKTPKIEEKIAELESIREINDNHISLNNLNNTILLIDNDSKFNAIVSELAQENGFKIIAIKSGIEGLSIAKETKPKAIILDVELPDIKGWEVMKRLKEDEQTKATPVFFLAENDESLNAKKMGAIGFLSKPVNIESLNKMFLKIRNYTTQTGKQIISFCDDEINARLKKENFNIKKTNNYLKGINILEQSPVDGIIIDFDYLEDNGVKLVESIYHNVNIPVIPMIVLTSKILTKSEHSHLQKFVSGIIIKSDIFIDRLIEEVKEIIELRSTKLSFKKETQVSFIHDKDSILENKNILLVDDDMRNVFALTSFLEGKGLNVIIGKNGNEAIQKMKDVPNLDLVLTDIMMPGMDGYEMIKAIRKMSNYENIPIIAVTAKAMKDDKTKCINAGANDYLTKPIDIDKLHSLLKIWLYKSSR